MVDDGVDGLNAQRAQDETHQKENEVKEGKRVVSSLQGDIHTLRVDLANMKKVIHQLERERANLQQEISDGRQENQQIMDEVRMRDIKVS